MSLSNPVSSLQIMVNRVSNTLEKQGEQHYGPTG